MEKKKKQVGKIIASIIAIIVVLALVIDTVVCLVKLFVGSTLNQVIVSTAAIVPSPPIKSLLGILAISIMLLGAFIYIFIQEKVETVKTVKMYFWERLTLPRNNGYFSGALAVAAVLILSVFGVNIALAIKIGLLIGMIICFLFGILIALFGVADRLNEVLFGYGSGLKAGMIESVLCGSLAGIIFGSLIVVQVGLLPGLAFMAISAFLFGLGLWLSYSLIIALCSLVYKIILACN
jgi:hypothetical protein